MNRYTFPESKESGFILDMDYNIQQQINQVMEDVYKRQTHNHTMDCIERFVSFINGITNKKGQKQCYYKSVSYTHLSKVYYQ